ncbi:Ankyrin repeat-rich membrane-spanning [Hyphodiscus hymeniophilus]|uniref:Ankyrin repeat-rich membrane-spanning n=1 Tax=Hyphodiscus hymeniophilus TaxID=353542 RepID=A0A9P6VI38_9HELO|nr:Ankyrin repeat-rich membrane-spanning [Hyphodiscus hymeniophilus]
MDPLSLTLSITSLISVALAVTKTLNDYTSSVKDAAAESNELAVEISGIAHALEALDRFLVSQGAKFKSFNNTSVLYSTIHTCHGRLSSLQSILEKFLKTSEGKKWYRSIVWPFKQDEQVETITILHRCMQIFQFSLSIDGCDLLSKTNEEVSEIRKTQSNTSGEVTEILSLVGNIQFVVEDFGQLYRGIHNEITAVHKGQLDSERENLLKWISSLADPSTNHNNAVKKREPETGVWFLESDDFYTWMRSGGFLWLYGIPGCGKTMLCSTIIEAVKEVCSESTTHILAYFYFDFQDIIKQDVVILLRSLIKQLCANEVELQDELQPMYAKYKASGLATTVEELTSILFSVIDRLDKKIYIMMDALDEYPEQSENSERRELLDQIERIVKHESGNLHILVTSRNEVDIRATLGTLANGGIYIQNSKVDADIGLFRWVVCQFDVLRNCKRVSAIKKALAELPKTLDETYARILSDIAENYFDEARSILRWVAFSARPLSLQEVTEAAVLRPGDDSLDPDERLYNAEDVLRICHGLIAVSREEVKICGTDTECDVVRFAHFSVQEYLMPDRAGSFSISDTSAHSYIAESCISYFLQMDLLDLSDQCLDDNPLLRYSAEYWFTHVQKIESDKDAAPGVLERTYNFLTQNSRNGYLTWLRIRDPGDVNPSYHFQHPINSFPPPLYYASSFGFRDATQRLLKTGTDVNIVQWLLDYKANVNTVESYHSGGFYGRALAIASEGGNEHMVEQLLELGADVNAPGSNKYGNALHQATANGHNRIVQRLLKAGADVNPPNCRKWCNLLQAAAAHGDHATFELLLEVGADVDARGGWQGSTLQAASERDYCKMVKRLLDMGVDVNTHSDGEYDPGTALQAASTEGHIQTVQLLLKYGADVNIQSGKGRDDAHGTPLQAASSRGHSQIVQLLLDSGADVNLPGRDYGSALQAAAEQGHDQIVRMLLNHGAEVNSQGDKEHAERSDSLERWVFKKYGNALQAASAWGNYQTVELLLDSGADINLRNEDYGTALEAALARGEEKMVQLLLGYGATDPA